MKRIMFGILFPTVLLASWEDHQVFETAMVQALSNKEVLMSTAFTSQLAQFVQTGTNGNDRATATLVFSISAMTSFEKTLDNALYLQSNNLASNVFTVANLETNGWQRFCTQLLLASSDTLNNKYQSACNTATNALQIIGQIGYTEPTNTVLRAILNHTFEAPDLNLQQALTIYAGLSLAILKHPVEARARVVNLPAKYRQMVEDIIAEDP
jgi:hypothetical protein